MKKQNIDFILNEGNTGQSHCQNTVSRKEESRRAPDLAEAKSLSSVWKKKTLSRRIWRKTAFRASRGKIT